MRRRIFFSHVFKNVSSGDDDTKGEEGGTTTEKKGKSNEESAETSGSGCSARMEEKDLVFHS